MIARGLLVLTALSSCVLSLPVTPSQLENDDDQVMKCIVEALADVLSRPHPLAVSQECLDTLRTDDSLVSILHHHNFLKELREIAFRGGQERAQLRGEAATSGPSTQARKAASELADRSMLEALGGPGERSILSEKKRTGNVGREEEKHGSLEDGESQEENNIAEEVQVKRENDESPGSHVSESEDEWSEGKAEKREDSNTEESSEDAMVKDKKGAGSGEKRDSHRKTSKEKSNEEEKEEKDKRSPFFTHRHREKQKEKDGEEDGEEKKRGGMEGETRWTKRGKALSVRKKKSGGKESQQQEVPHHSKEVSEEVEEKKKRNTQRSPEEKELQMIARRRAEERRGSEEEGSASRKSEEPEIESLATIESELENFVQKVHEMRQG